MKIQYSLLLFLSFLLISCSSSNTRITGSWANKEKLKNRQIESLFIAVLTSNIEAKTTLEDELAYQAAGRGIEAIKSYKIFKQTFTKDDVPSREELLTAIKSTNAQTIFTISLLDKETSTRYVPGTAAYRPLGFGYYGNFYGYYTNIYPIMYEPGYYTTDKIYYIESNLYDAGTEELLWSAQSATYNPSDLENFVKNYTQTLLKQLEKDGLIKREK